MGYSFVAEVRELLRKGERVVYRFDKKTSTLKGTRSLIEGEICDGTKEGYIARTAVLFNVDVVDAKAYERLNEQLGLIEVVD